MQPSRPSIWLPESNRIASGKPGTLHRPCASLARFIVSWSKRLIMAKVGTFATLWFRLSRSGNQTFGSVIATSVFVDNVVASLGSGRELRH